MNIYFVHADGSIVTPELSGSILEGVTRDSIMQIARDLGHEVQERRISIDEWRTGTADGTITEVFACGTAAVVTPIASLKWDGGEAVSGDGETGKVTTDIRSALVDVQYGRAEDRHGWLRQVAPAK
jgi:branched-chain amino acid aminotransferase